MALTELNHRSPNDMLIYYSQLIKSIDIKLYQNNMIKNYLLQ